MNEIILTTTLLFGFAVFIFTAYIYYVRAEKEFYKAELEVLNEVDGTTE